MKTLKGIGILVALAAMLLPALTAETAAASSQTAQARLAARPYLSHTLRADASSQCGLGLTSRSGEWFCPGEHQATVAKRGYAIDRVLLPARPDPAGQGFCNMGGFAEGCYTISSGGTVASIQVSGDYGYGTKVLGSVTYNLTWRLNGHQLAKMSGSWTSTGTVDEFYYEAALDSVSSNTSGASVGGHVAATTSPQQAVIAGGHTYTWTAPVWFNNGYANYTAEMGPSWVVSGYPGYWWMNVRSPIYHCASSTSACYFQYNAPAGAVAGGYYAY